MLKNRIFRLFFSLFCLLSIHLSLFAELPNAKDIQAQLDSLKQQEQNDETKATTQDLQDTLSWLEQIDQQKADNEKLRQQIENAPKALEQNQTALNTLRSDSKTLEQLKASFAGLSVDELQDKINAGNKALQELQTKLAELNANFASQKSSPERSQGILTTNATRSQAINDALAKQGLTASAKTRLNAELALIQLKNTYAQLLLSGNDNLSAQYASLLDKENFKQQQLQNELTALQDVINEKTLQQSQDQVKQATELQQKNATADTNPVIVQELNTNTQISEELLKQTAELNQLSQDNLRIKNVLDNLQQTQRNIDDQISALQGTLLLSRIINKQQQALPQDQLVKGLSKQIADLRVRIFDVTGFRDRINNVESYIAELEKTEKTTFNSKEREQLTTLLQERSKVLSEWIKQLNSQLNLSINIEFNQQQVKTISEALQSKLKQQSFWVRSNAVMDFDWFKNFPTFARFQLNELSKKFDFSNWRDNLAPAAALILLLIGLTLLINKKKTAIKQRLTQINNRIKTVNTDSQWNTPTAIMWTLILCLPSTFLFLTAFILVTYIGFQDPTPMWRWGLKMAGYWLYFAFMLEMLRPNGIAYHHFNMPQQANETFRNVLRRSVWLVALLLNTSIFSNLEGGIGYDVIGEIVNILVLITMVFVIIPDVRRAISAYRNVANGGRNYALYFISILLLLAPIALIVLIVMGYYYTSLILIDHLVESYFAITTWILFRNVVYRGFTVASRRLTARRLKEKREQAKSKVGSLNSDEDSETGLTLQEEGLAVSEIKNQMLKTTDFLLWAGLFLLLYWVWSDLITVAYYLDGVTLWKQSVTTETGTVLESITLFNLLIAIAIIIVTYVLVRNISGVLEVLLFSNLKLSQGTPYTITTLLTYGIISLGAMLAFSTLGVSWSKLQWLFAALSVGLGFGMQEIFANFVSGIIILFERPVRIGDVVTIDSFSGTVSKIQIRATTIIDFDKKEVIVPNKSFVTGRIINWALNSSVTRLIIKVGVGYDSNLELVRQLLLQAAEENERVLKDPQPNAYFMNFGDSTLDHELRCYVGQISDRTRTVDALNRRIYELFKQHNIEIAFNQLDVFIKNPMTNEEVKLGSEKIEFKY